MALRAGNRFSRPSPIRRPVVLSCLKEEVFFCPADRKRACPDPAFPVSPGGAGRRIILFWPFSAGKKDPGTLSGSGDGFVGSFLKKPLRFARNNRALTQSLISQQRNGEERYGP